MTEVLIVGAGSVGLMTALGLARDGVSVTLLETEDDIVYSPRAISYAWSIQPALQLFGVLDDMIAAGHIVDDRCWRIFKTGETVVYNHELDAVKALRPTGGLMLRRDGSSLPWFGKGQMLTQVQRISKKVILAAGLRPELTFTSFGRHSGTTEASTSGLTETQLMQKGQWSSTAAMAHYLHDDDEAKQNAQMKRIKRRAKLAKQATVK